MKQWELFGITDDDPDWTPKKKAPEPEIGNDDADEPQIVDRFPSMFWMTDAKLRFTAAPGISRLGLGAVGDLFEAFAIDRPDSEVIEAHVRSLGGEATTFELEMDGHLHHCWVSPVRGSDGQVCGTICVGLEVSVDVTAPTVELA